MLDYTSHTDAQKALESAQESERDMRQIIKDVEIFLHKKDGQWESTVISQRGSTRPRYTFDMCNPIVDQVAGPLQRSDFAIKVLPAGSDANNDIAKTYAGLVRNTENLSKAHTLIYKPSIKRLVATGLAGWEIKQKYVDPKSFDQDLILEPCNNIIETVWIDEHSLLQDNSDAKHGWKLVPMSKNAYEKKWPDGSGLSIGTNENSTSYTEKPEFIIVAKFFYLKAKKTTLVQMSNGRVYNKDSDEYKKIKDELKAIGVTETGERESELMTCYQRFYDAGGWLTKEEATVFDGVPLVLVYGNYEVIENKRIYNGEVLHLMDSQRVLNYSETKKVEETALSPKSKILATPKQFAAHKTSWETMNTNNEPALPYDIDPNSPSPPFRIDGGSVNIGLESVSQNMRSNIQSSSGMFAPQMGNNPFQQSGKALEIQVNQGQEGKEDYFNALVVAYERTAQLLIGGYPKLHDTKKQVRLLNQDGSFDMVMLHDVIKDEQTGEEVEINNLAQGVYDVSYDVGPGYKNQQQETVDAFLRMGEVDPSFIAQGKDIMVGQLNAPGMSDMKDRIREQMIMAGQIPEEQMSEEEKAKVQQMQANQEGQPPTPEQMIGEAELIKAQTDQQTAQFDQQVKQVELQQAQQKLDMEREKIRMQSESDGFKAGKILHETGLQADKMEADITSKYVESVKKMADMGVADPVGAVKQIENTFIDAEFDKRLKGMSTEELIGMVQ
jgi:hypothetical protein